MILLNFFFGFLFFKAISCLSEISHGKTNLFQEQYGVSPGGAEDKNPNDSKYLELAELAINKYKRDNGSNKEYLVTEVTRATEQVVEGLLTEIEFYALQSSYFQPLYPNGDVIIPDTLLCHSSVIEKPWLHIKDISVSCDLVLDVEF